MRSGPPSWTRSELDDPYLLLPTSTPPKSTALHCVRTALSRAASHRIPAKRDGMRVEAGEAAIY
jgi:hypothetical protein